MERTHTAVIGASAAGLATSACLKRHGVQHVLLERARVVGAAWRGHYDRLHLHTTKGLSTLPYMPWPRSVPRYPARDDVVAYLERYVQAQALEPRFGCEVTRVCREGDGFVVESTGGAIAADKVVLATGYARVPVMPTFPGADVFRGEIIHSSTYRNGASWKGKPVLVVGFGNSAGEIAIDLYEHGAMPTLSVRSAVNVIPRDFFGVPVLGVGIVMGVLPAPVADALSEPMIRATVGNIERVGLRRLPYGPNTQIRRDGRVPLLDIGTIRLLRKGRIVLRSGIERFTADGVRFSDGVEEPFDAVVMATGYRPRVTDLLEDAEAICDEHGTPRTSGCEVAPGLYLCGFYISPTGMFRAIAKEARTIAASIARG